MAGLGQNEMEAQGRHAVAGPVERQVRRRFGVWTGRHGVVVLRVALDGKALCDPCFDVAAKDAGRLAECWTDGREDSVAVACGFAALWAAEPDLTARRNALPRCVVVFSGCGETARRLDEQRRSNVLAILSWTCIQAGRLEADHWLGSGAFRCLT